LSALYGSSSHFCAPIFTVSVWPDNKSLLAFGCSDFKVTEKLLLLSLKCVMSKGILRDAHRCLKICTTLFSLAGGLVLSTLMSDCKNSKFDCVMFKPPLLY